MAVSMATLATLIGGGGLGDFIYQGFIWLGAIPVALLTMTLEFLMGRIEIACQTMRHRFKSDVTLWVMALPFVLMLGPQLFHNRIWAPTSESIVVASTTSVEQNILTELVAQTIEHHLDPKVVRHGNLGSTSICHQALIKGDVDLYIEYASTIHDRLLDQTSPVDAKNQLNTIQEQPSNPHQLMWLQPFLFKEHRILVVRSEWAKKYGLDNISDLSQLSMFSLAGSADSLVGEDGLPGLLKHHQMTMQTKSLSESI